MHTLVVDIGGIFFSPLWRKRGMDEVSVKLGVQKDTFKNALKVGKNNFYEGRISEYGYWQAVLEELGNTEFSPKDMAGMYRMYITPIPETLSLLPELSSRHVLVSCNNAPKEWMDERIRMANLDAYFSHFFTSGYIGAQKPNSEMYAQVFNHATSLGHPIVYIDDSEDYIQAASAMKFDIETLVYADAEDLLRWIR